MAYKRRGLTSGKPIGDGGRGSLSSSVFTGNVFRGNSLGADEITSVTGPGSGFDAGSSPSDYTNMAVVPIPTAPSGGITAVNVCPAGQTRNAYGYCIPNASSSPSLLSSILSAFTPAPQRGAVMMPGSSGGVSTTALVIGGVAVLGVVALIASRK